jgi:carbon-monoxide dehydrogenase medium subunit
MKARAFSYLRARTIEEALAAHAQGGEDARFIAGGQSLVPALSLRLQAPQLLIDITHIPELGGVRREGECLRIGALTRHCEILSDPLVGEFAPLLRAAAPFVAHPAIRNRGTLGGSIALADPAAEYPACMVALDATIVVAGKDGERMVKASDFFKGLFEVDLAPGELVVAVEFPAQLKDQRSVFLELARRHGDYAMIGLAAYRGKSTRFVFLGAGATPVLAKAASQASTIQKAKLDLEQDLSPPADLYNTSATKLHLAKVLLERAWNTLSTSH